MSGLQCLGIYKSMQALSQGSQLRTRFLKVQGVMDPTTGEGLLPYLKWGTALPPMLAVM